ncbi:MAG: hypothetical protein LQ340_005068 [Diploschistes diacapsis]|nr:MAG: hypothetical protein LQ340_005068 [Diploschistes diacapsis]
MTHSSTFNWTASIRLLLASLSLTIAQCPTSITPTNSIKPTVASDYAYQVVATGLTAPRSLQFDSAGNLLVLEQNKGLSSHVLKDNGGPCVSFSSSKYLIQDTNLTHGLALSPDESIVYVSSSSEVYAYSYDATSSSVGANRSTLVTGMQGTDHTTRTLLYPRHVNNTLVVSRGSTSNFDIGATTVSTGISQVRAFALNGSMSSPYDYGTSGMLLGWGLRNDVGVAEHPTTGGIWSVENSIDQLTRNGADIHENNPGEELNWLGYLNGTNETTQGTDFGYPYCLTAWDPSVLPDNGNITVGTPFASVSSNDSMCAKTTVPRLTFQAHMAPIDIKFNGSSGTDAWISFHGSWDRTDPVGYKVAMVKFANGQPVDLPTSNTSVTTILGNANNTACPDNCFRPTGLTFDSKGRLFVASDASGEFANGDKRSPKLNLELELKRVV